MGWAGDVSSNPCCWRDASSSCWAGTLPTSSTTQTLRSVCRCAVLFGRIGGMDKVDVFFLLLLFFFRVCLGWVGGWCLEDGEESRNPLQSVWLHCKQLLFLSTIFKHSFTYLWGGE